MPAAEFALFVFFVAGALPDLLDLHLMVGKLRNTATPEVAISPVAKGRTLVCAAKTAAGFGLTSVIVLKAGKARPQATQMSYYALFAMLEGVPSPEISDSWFASSATPPALEFDRSLV